MKKVKYFFDHIEEYIIAICLAVMTVITVANVFSRKVIHQSWSFTEEITTNMFILSSLLGAAVAAKKGSHLGLSILQDLCPKKYRKYFSLITVAAAGFFFFFLLKYGFTMVSNEFKTKQTTPSLGWPEWIFGAAVPLGGLFLIIRFFQFGIKEFMKGEEK